jgi:FlaA1/EpsC-like NDP-sugar epimerase
MNLLRILAHPRAAVIGHDLAMIIAAWLAAILCVAYDSFPGIVQSLPLWGELSLVLVIQGLVLWAAGLYKGLWRFASFPDLWNIARAALIGTTLILAALSVFLPAEISHMIGVVALFRSCCFALGVPRICFRAWKDLRLPAQRESSELNRVLVLGAGRSGALLERELRRRGNFNVVGFLDDNRRLRGAQVRGIPVLGPIKKLPRFAREVNADRPRCHALCDQSANVTVVGCERSELNFEPCPHSMTSATRRRELTSSAWL